MGSVGSEELDFHTVADCWYAPDGGRGTIYEYSVRPPGSDSGLNVQPPLFPPLQSCKLVSANVDSGAQPEEFACRGAPGEYPPVTSGILEVSRISQPQGHTSKLQ
jgi:hypothetical protein